MNGAIDSSLNTYFVNEALDSSWNTYFLNGALTAVGVQMELLTAVGIRIL